MRNVKSPPANRSGGSRIVRKEGLGLHGTPVDLPVYRNATIFVIIRTFDHILFSYKNIHNSISNENIHNSISNDLRVISLANEHGPHKDTRLRYSCVDSNKVLYGKYIHHVNDSDISNAELISVDLRDGFSDASQTHFDIAAS